jgi:F1F0 ATPase subunit 2
MSAGLVSDLSLGFLAGLALGALHLWWLWHATARLVVRVGGMGALLGGAALRLAVVLAGFSAVANVAAEPGLALIAALGGFVLARTLVLSRARHVRR